MSFVTESFRSDDISGTIKGSSQHQDRRQDGDTQQGCPRESCFHTLRRFGDCKQIPYGISFLIESLSTFTWPRPSSFTLSLAQKPLDKDPVARIV